MPPVSPEISAHGECVIHTPARATSHAHEGRFFVDLSVTFKAPFTFRPLAGSPLREATTPPVFTSEVSEEILVL